MPSATSEPLGWKYLSNAPKWHFFAADGRSLCGRWMTLSTQPGERGNNGSPDNCAACRRKLEKLESRATAA